MVTNDMNSLVTNEQIAVMLGHIDEKIDRLVWRADQTETKQTELDRRLTILETTMIAKQNSVGSKMVEKGGLVFLGILITFIAKQLGLV